MSRRAQEGGRGWPAYGWALIGALWGLMSMVPAIVPHWYFNELLGSASAYRAGRILMWAMPSWYAARVVSPSGRDSSLLPSWALFGVLAVASIALGAAIALSLWGITEWLRSAVARRRNR